MEPEMPNATASRIRAYLDDLDRALSDLPKDRRTEILRDIRGHIDVALSERDNPSSAEVEQLLEELGTPAEIAEAAYAEQPPAAPQISGRDLFAVIALLIGGFVFCVGWFVGAVMLWTSNTWSVKDKVVATLLVPGGLVAALLVLVSGGFAVSETSCVSDPVRVSATAPTGTATSVGHHCTTSGAGTGVMVVGYFVLAVSILGPLYTTAMLVRAARRVS
jgi:hypothetical protein